MRIGRTSRSSLLVFLSLFCFFIFGVTLMRANLCTHILVLLLKMGAALGACLVFKTVVLFYRSYSTHLKHSKWKEKALKNTQKRSFKELLSSRGTFGKRN